MSDQSENTLRIEYIKSNSFRIVHVDGAFGGSSPRLDLFVTFYSERFPIPKILTYTVSPTGAPENEIQAERETKTGIVREVEVGVMMDFTTAKAFSVWLNEKVDELEKQRKQILPEKPQGQEINK